MNSLEVAVGCQERLIDLVAELAELPLEEFVRQMEHALSLSDGFEPPLSSEEHRLMGRIVALAKQGMVMCDALTLLRRAKRDVNASRRRAEVNVAKNEGVQS